MTEKTINVDNRKDIVLRIAKFVRINLHYLLVIVLSILFSRKRSVSFFSKLIYDNQRALAKFNFYWKWVEYYYSSKIDTLYFDIEKYRIYEKNIETNMKLLDKLVKVRASKYKKYTEMSRDLVWVMGTGRNGCDATYHFFGSSPDIYSIHRDFRDEKFYEYGSSHGTKSEVLHRFTETKLSINTLEKITDKYLEKRLITIRRSKGRKFIFCEHHDEAWTPFIIKVFPHSKIIHLLRDSKLVIQSYVTKGQYTANQVIPIRAPNSFKLQHYTLFKTICWFIGHVNFYIYACCKDLSKNRFLFLRSEDLFLRKVDTYNKLIDFVGVDIEIDKYNKCYSVKENKNSKSNLSQHSKFFSINDWPDTFKSIYDIYTFSVLRLTNTNIK